MFCLSLQGLFKLALRQTLGLVENLLRLAWQDWQVQDYSTVCRRQKTLQVQIGYRPSAQPLQLLVDSTAIQFLGEGECKRRKHGAEYRREWRKVHLGIDAQTLEIRAIEVTSNAIGDALMRPELLTQIPPEEAIASVCADGAYDTRCRRDFIALRWAQAVIPPRSNASVWHRPSPGAESRNEAVRACSRLGRRLWKTWRGYCRRSPVHGFKRLGERVMARTFERQVVELHVRVALLNRFTQIGRPTTVAVSAMA